MTRHLNPITYSEIPLCGNPSNLPGAEKAARVGHPQIRLRITNEILGERPLIGKRVTPGEVVNLFPYPNIYLVFHVGRRSRKFDGCLEKCLDNIEEVRTAENAITEAERALALAKEENERYFQTLPNYTLVMAGIAAIKNVRETAENRHKGTRKNRDRTIATIADVVRPEYDNLMKQRGKIVSDAKDWPRKRDELRLLENHIETSRRAYAKIRGSYDTFKNRQMWLEEYLKDPRNKFEVPFPSQVINEIARGAFLLHGQPNPPMRFYELENPRGVATNRFGDPLLGPPDASDEYEQLLFPLDVFLSAQEPEGRNQFTIVGDRRWGAFVPFALGQEVSNNLSDPTPGIVLACLQQGQMWALSLSDHRRNEIILNVNAALKSVIPWLLAWNPHLPPAPPQLLAQNPTPDNSGSEGGSNASSQEEGSPQLH